jgi:DNA-binding MarR family transcriptional regulator
MTDDIDVELAARLRVAIARLGRQLRQQAGTWLSPTLHSTLATIAVYGPLPLGELAAREQITPPTVTKIVAKLGEQGLVRRERDPVDGRVVRISLTELGQARFDESKTRRTAWLVTRLDQLGITDRSRLLATVELLEAIVQPDGIGAGEAGAAAAGPVEPGAPA